jgi:hypothetical protein
VPVLALAIAVLYAIGIIVSSTAFAGLVWIILTILLALLSIAIGLMAGAVVVKSLFAVAAELSLLIFLTQAFCGAPTRHPANNAAMTVLFTIGMLYIAYLFFVTLKDELKGVYDRRLAEHPHTWEKVVTIAAFIAFVLLFVWELYLIVAPIVRGLCVYK